MNNPEIYLGDDLKVGYLYGYGQSDNQFKIIWAYKDYLWVEWQSDEPEIETLYLDSATHKKIIILK